MTWRVGMVVLGLAACGLGLGACGGRGRVIEPLPEPPMGALLDGGDGHSPPPEPESRPASRPATRPASRPKDLPPAEAGWLPAKPSATWTHIVIHHSASAEGNAALFDQWHKARKWDGLGYHFVIGNGRGSGDGQVEVGYRWTGQARGAHTDGAGLGVFARDEPGYYNIHGIGICLVGDFQKTRPTARQMAALAKLCRFLMARFDIPRENIIGHYHTKDTTECPGKNFDFAELYRRLGVAVAARE